MEAIEEAFFQSLPTQNLEETIQVEWSLLASRQLARTLTQIERDLQTDEITAAINHLLMYHRQGGKPVYDWMLSYLGFEFNMLPSLDSSAKMQMLINYAQDRYQPQAAVTDDTIEVYGFQQALETPEVRTIIDMQIYGVDVEPPRLAISDVTERNNRLLREMEEIVSEAYGLDDEQAQLSPIVEMFLLALGTYLDSEFTLAEEGLQREENEMVISLVHNARPRQLDLRFDLDAARLVYEKMLREMP